MDSVHAMGIETSLTENNTMIILRCVLMLKFIVQLKTLMVITYNVDGLKVCGENVMTYALYCFQQF